MREYFYYYYIMNYPRITWLFFHHEWKQSWSFPWLFVSVWFVFIFLTLIQKRRDSLEGVTPRKLWFFSFKSQNKEIVSFNKFPSMFPKVKKVEHLSIRLLFHSLFFSSEWPDLLKKNKQNLETIAPNRSLCNTLFVINKLRMLWIFKFNHNHPPLFSRVSTPWNSTFKRMS